MEKIIKWINFLIGNIVAFFTSYLGGFSPMLTTLLIFMLCDYLTGVITALFFQKSDKTESGGLSSKAGFKGLIKKGALLLLVLIGHRLDITFGINYLKDCICVTIILNEVTSILENFGLMGLGIKIPILQKFLDVMNEKNNNIDLK